MLVIYKGLAGFCVTTQDNYNSRIMNANKVTDCSDFENPEQIIEYYCKWFNAKREDFTVIS